MNFRQRISALNLFFCWVQVCAALKCNIEWKKVGCFHDSIKDRPLKREVLNRRDIFNHHNDGEVIDWNNWEDSMQSLACRCGEIIHDLGYSYFGLQFYGECWTGQNASRRYYKDGQAPNCIGVGYKPCDDKASTPCVGPAAVNYVYTVVPKVITPVKTDGGYTEWTSWTNCSKTCGGGMQFRKRACTNPSPANDGKDCADLGKPEEARKCNTYPCLPVCTKAMDLGIILDASSSIGAKNYSYAKDFVKRLVDHYDISANGTHVGIIHYSWKAHVDLTFADSKYYDVMNLKAKINSIVYSYGGTRADLALEAAEKELFCNKCGIRPNKPKVLITMTDGHIPTFSKPLKEASAGLKSSGVKSIALGIGSVKMEQLRDMSSGDRYIFTSKTIGELHKLLLEIVSASCPT